MEFEDVLVNLTRITPDDIKYVKITNLDTGETFQKTGLGSDLFQFFIDQIIEDKDEYAMTVEEVSDEEKNFYAINKLLINFLSNTSNRKQYRDKFIDSMNVCCEASEISSEK